LHKVLAHSGEQAGYQDWFATQTEHRHPYDAPVRMTWSNTPSLRASRMQVRVAVIFIVVVGSLTCALIPFAGRTGPALAGFVPAYQTAVGLFYALSFLHLVNHYRRTRLRALLHIAALCLFSAAVLLVQMFSFPIWGPVQLVGNSPATTSWLWTFWHLGPAVLAISYVVSLGRSASLAATKPQQRTGQAVACMVVATAALVGLATALATWGVQYLPVIVHGDDYTTLTSSGVGPFVLGTTIFSAVLLVWRTRCASTMELCLAMSLILLVFDDALTLAGGSRLSVGWYAGRAEAAASAAMLLCFYVLEIDRRFAQVSADAKILAHDREVLNDLVVEQRDLNNALAIQAREDGLTGLANRRRFDEQLQNEWLRARREGQPLSLLMIDVDFFKLYNDTYGHLAGDECLRTIASLIRNAARRPADLCARYGGEEFAILLPNNDLQQATETANGLNCLLAWRNIEHSASPLGFVSASIGIACMHPKVGNGSAADLVEAADRALYSAKSGGRNRAVAIGAARYADNDRSIGG
jgi:diguanylate cyclase (GGDEF)-like protein